MNRRNSIVILALCAASGQLACRSDVAIVPGNEARTPESPTPQQLWTNPIDGLEYVWIPPGTFSMGCVPSDSECEADELPSHSVILTRGYWMGRTEVTVGSFDPNGFGLFDMAGNVYEWVSDWYADDYYAWSPAEDPRGPNNGRYRVLRGGAWSYYTTRLRVSARPTKRPGDAQTNVGFRCAIDGS